MATRLKFGTCFWFSIYCASPKAARGPSRIADLRAEFPAQELPVGTFCRGKAG
jgi:hypothetical protein